MNILGNPSFEEGWYHPDGIPELQIPNQWGFWWADGYVFDNPISSDPGNKFVRPEVRVLPKSQLPEHEQDLFVLDGEYCVKIFKGSGAWWGDLFQFVDGEPGRYRMTVNVYPDLVDHYKDDEKVAAQDPDSGRIKFDFGFFETEWEHLLKPNANGVITLHKVQFIKEFDAPNGIEGMSVQFMLPHALNNSCVFLDAWTLVKVADLTPDRGQPREQYKRIYNVIPSTATMDQATKIFQEAWKRSRETVGGSYDDAGVGDLDERHVNLYGLSKEVHSKYLEFYKTHYPDVNVKFVGTPTEPEPPKPVEPLPGEFISLHRQTNIDGLYQYIEKAKPRWVKLVGGMEDAKYVKQASPDTKVLYRHVIDHQEPYYNTPVPKETVGIFLSHFWEGIEINAEYIDAIEGLNEEIPTAWPDKLKQVVAFERELALEVARRDIGVKTCLLNAAVGNPGHNEVVLMLPVAKVAHDLGHYIGYHPYFPANPQHAEKWMAEEGKHHHMRALLSYDPAFESTGYRVKYLFTECGAIGTNVREDGRPGGYISSASGWRSPDCLNGDRSRYYSLLLMWRNQVAEWNKYHNNRAEGATLFTIGADFVGWHNFKLWKEDLDALATIL